MPKGWDVVNSMSKIRIESKSQPAEIFAPEVQVVNSMSKIRIESKSQQEQYPKGIDNCCKFYVKDTN